MARLSRRSTLNAELAGLDALESILPPTPKLAWRIWAAIWPKLLAVAIVIGVWQIVVWSGWKPEYVVPSPVDRVRRASATTSATIIGRGRRHAAARGRSASCSRS